MPSGLPLCYATHLLLVFAISDSYVRDVGHMKWACRHIISQLFVAEIERADKWVFLGGVLVVENFSPLGSVSTVRCFIKS